MHFNQTECLLIYKIQITILDHVWYKYLFFYFISPSKRAVYVKIVRDIFIHRYFYFIRNLFSTNTLL